MSHLVTVNFQLTPHVRRETHGGVEYVVAPVVAVRVGVLNGAWLPAEELAKTVSAWNGVPLPVGHPQEDGNFISVNREDILATCVGTFQRATFDGTALRGELWIDVAKATTQGSDALIALQQLEQGTRLEVSTAYETDLDQVAGSLHGHAYTGIQRNIRPDHLALLPHQKGACSWEHGCGAPRVNQQKELPVKTFWQTMKARLLGQVSANITQSFDDVRHVLWDAIQEAEGMMNAPIYADMPSYYIEDVYKDRVIYSLANELYERSYTLDKDGQATLGDRSSVVKEVRYLPATTPVTNANTAEVPLDLSLPAPRPAGEPAAAPLPSLSPNAHQSNCDCSACTEQHVNQEVHMDKKELVTNVLKAQGLDEAERAHFEALPDAVLQKLVVKAEPTPAPKPEPALTVPGITQEQLQAALAAVLPKINPDVAYMQEKQVTLAAQQRAQVTAHVVANSNFTQAQCDAMDFRLLEQMAVNLHTPANYDGRAFPQFTANADEDTVPDPPSIMLAPVTPVSH